MKKITLSLSRTLLSKLKKQYSVMGFTSLEQFTYFLLVNHSRGNVHIDLQSDVSVNELFSKLQKVEEDFAKDDYVYKTLGKESTVVVPADLYKSSYNQILQSTKHYINTMYNGIVTESREAFFHIHWLQHNNFEILRDSYRYYCDLYGLHLSPNNQVAVLSYKQQGYDVALYAVAYPAHNFHSVELTQEGVEKSRELLNNILKLTNTSVTNGDGTEMLNSFNNNSLGTIIANWTLSISVNPVEKLILMHKKLADNGILVLTESAGTSYPKTMYDKYGILHLWEKRMDNYVLKTYIRDLEKILLKIGFQVITHTLDIKETHDTVIAIKTNRHLNHVSQEDIRDKMRNIMVTTRVKILQSIE